MSSLVVHGGPIHTFAETVAPPAILVEDGRVAALGTVDDCRRAARETPRLYDVERRVVLPGFVDAHVHPLLLGDAMSSADLSGARTVEDVLGTLRTHAARHPGEGVVTGYGYDQSKLAEHRHPTRTELDAVAADRHVRIQHASGHGYVVNTCALRESGIDAATPTPPGGRIDRDADGEPTGVVFDAACDLLTGPDGVKIANHGPNFHLPLADPQRCLAAAQRALLAVGVTSICDAQVTARETRAYFDARQAGTLSLRVHMLALSSSLPQLEDLGIGGRLGDDALELLGVKLYADGSVIARTAYLGHACCGPPSPSGYLYHEPEELASLITAAHRLGLPTATHAQGEVPIGVVLDAVAAARTERPLPHLVHRIEHCGFPTPQQIERMAQLTVVPVPQPVQVRQYADSLIAEYGDYGGRFYPVGEFARAGLPVVVSSDGPVTEPDPLRAAASAVTRRTLGDDVAGGVDDGRPVQGVDPATALRGITTTPARLLGCRDVGRLTVGSPADFVILDEDPVAGGVEAMLAATVTETWIGGDRVYEDGAQEKETR